MSAITINVRTTKEVSWLFYRAAQAVPSSRNEIFAEALHYALSEDISWLALSQSKIAVNESADYMISSGSIQLRADPDAFKQVSENIRSAFTPPLKRLALSAAVKLIMSAYVEHLSLMSEILPELPTNELIPGTDFYSLSINDKLDVIYELLLEIKGETAS